MAVKPGNNEMGVRTVAEGWKLRRLSDDIKLLSGLHVLAKQCNAEGKGTPYLTGPADFPNGLIQHTKFTTAPGAICRRNDILVTVKGSGAGSLVMSNDEYCISRQLMAVHVQTWNPRYIYYSLLRDVALWEAAAAGLIPGLSRGEILGKNILLPPTEAEQEAVAEALSDMDVLIESLEQLIAKKRQIKQGATQELLTGKRRLPGFSGEWETVRLGDVLLAKPDYGINAPATPFSDKLPAYIRITDISEDGRFRPAPRVSVKSAAASQSYLCEGDVVFARTGASVGKSYAYDLRDGDLVFAGFLIRIHPNSQLLVPAFLAAYVTTKPYWNWVRLMSMRSGQPGINGNEYAQLPLPRPPLAEQAALAEVLSDMDAELVALEKRRDKIRALKQGMMQELLTGRIRLV